MRAINTFPAAAGLFLALAVGTFAAPITSEPFGGGRSSGWAPPAAYLPRERGWAFHKAHHRPHGLDLRSLWLQYDHRSHAGVSLPFGPERLDEGYPLRPWLCGGEPGAGLAQYPSEGPGPGASDEEDDAQSGDEAPDARISESGDLDRDAAPIPAVPEPGSLAMLGAGALGLLAARGLLKDR